MKGRLETASWTGEKRAVIAAALERFAGIPGGEMRALEVTESAITELAKQRQQVGHWAPCIRLCSDDRGVYGDR
jgi:hypothetical protein